jgi:hypothetical protein
MEMQFTPADIARLYGGRLYVIRERGEAQATPKTPSPAVPETEAEKPAEKPVRKAKTTAPEAQPEVKQETAPSTPALTWKLKNDSPKVIFMLPEIEFGNKQLTELLRKIVVASQVPTDDVGFGVIHHKPSAADLAAMPAPYGFLLDDSMSPFPANVAEIEGRKIWVAKKLSLMAKDDSLKADLWRMMKEFMQLLRA